MDASNMEEIRSALLALDELYEQEHSFATWLSGQTPGYEPARQALEKRVPGFAVVRVNVTYRMAHVLLPLQDGE